MSLKAGFNNDFVPERVVELCAQEPWSKDGVTPFEKQEFGSVPEKFDRLAEGHFKATQVCADYENAAAEARAIYKQQMLSDIKKYCDFNNPNGGTSREELENTVTYLMKLRRVYDSFGTKEGKGIAARLNWSGMMIGDWYMKNNPSRDNGNLVNGRTPSGIGYQQFRAK